ncbi:MAG: hypothetical protein ABIU63_13630 [Chitinophagaceae bacterium]
MEDNKSAAAKKDNKDAVVKPDAETLHTTDPQDHMEGPISSLVQGVKDEAKKEDGTLPEKKKD